MPEHRSDPTGETSGTDAIAVAAVLSEPVRRRLYEHVVGRHDPVDRDDAAEATGIGRPLAAFHLDRLVAAGLLDVEYHRRSGRSGPGAGRPAKFYRRRRDLDVELSLPTRRYRMAAEIFAEGLDRTPDQDAADDVRGAARARGAAVVAARRTGRPSASAARRSVRARREELVSVLAAEGFEPTEDGDEIRLWNCPFDVLVAEHRGLTCSMNLSLLEGVADAVGDTGVQPVSRPAEGSCCVRFVRSSA
jgi:predicted ArsR family transcriptional regulator